MDKLIKDFNTIYPKYSASFQEGRCVIHERQNEGEPCKFKTLILEGFNGWQFQSPFLKNLSSFYIKSNEGLKENKHNQLLRRDCDGLLYQKTDTSLNIYAFELKSGFSTDSINKAKNQLLGTFLMVRAQLSLLHSFYELPLNYIGVIVAYSPTVMQRDAILKLKMFQNPVARFCHQLYESNHYEMPKENLNSFYSPLIFPDIRIKYLPVPKDADCHTVDFSDLSQ